MNRDFSYAELLSVPAPGIHKIADGLYVEIGPAIFDKWGPGYEGNVRGELQNAVVNGDPSSKMYKITGFVEASGD